MTASAPPPHPAAAPPRAGSEARVDVRFDGGTVRFTQRQMAEAFATASENVLAHLRNVFASGELEAGATTKDFLAVRTEGKRRARRRLKHYNLDAIVSVGYRVNSRRACTSASGPPAPCAPVSFAGTP